MRVPRWCLPSPRNRHEPSPLVLLALAVAGAAVGTFCAFAMGERTYGPVAFFCALSSLAASEVGTAVLKAAAHNRELAQPPHPLVSVVITGQRGRSHPTA